VLRLCCPGWTFPGLLGNCWTCIGAVVGAVGVAAVVGAVVFAAVVGAGGVAAVLGAGGVGAACVTRLGFALW